MKTSDKALIVVDIQKDFLPGGSLAVPNGDEVIDVANTCMRHFKENNDLVVATQDWHPENHMSFAENQGLEPFDSLEDPSVSIGTVWPVHCVQNTEGAEFADDLDTDLFDEVFQKGTNPKVDSYSGFYDNDHKESTGLTDYLQDRGVKDTFILGLAADVCVQFTVMDSLIDGFNTYLVRDGTRGVDMNEGDTEEAIELISKRGAEITTSEDIVS